MPKIQLLALDLDGTLLGTDSRVSRENARAVRLAQQAGVQIVLCTGRNLTETRAFNAQLDASADWAVITNGAAVMRFSDGAQMAFDGLDREMCAAVRAICAKFGLDLCIYTADRLYYGRDFLRFLEELRRRGHVTLNEADEGYEFVPDKAKWDEVLAREDGRIVKAILHHLDPAEIDKIMQALEKTGRFELTPSVMYGGELKNVEINRKGVHKGYALAKLAAQLGLDMNAVMAIGDSDNDLTMLQTAGLGVAMANAAPHIRAAANAVTLDNASDGVAAAIKRYILEE